MGVWVRIPPRVLKINVNKELTMASRLTELVKGKKARFIHFVDKQLWYKTDCGFEFPVPLDDVGTTLFVAEYNAIRLMKWIRIHLGMIDKEKEEFLKSM